MAERNSLRLPGLALAMAALAASAVSACNCGSTSVSADASVHRGDGGTGDGSVTAALSLTPTDPVLTLRALPYPTVQFVARSGGKEVAATFSLDRPELGTLDAAGLFTPSGTAGRATVTASAGGESATTSLTVEVALTQNGAPGADGGFDPGGWAGVGGEGPGPEVTAPVREVLDSTPLADPSLALLYPYDRTVWPLGQLAPLLQWTADAALLNGTEAVRIHLSCGGFDYVGSFGRPGPLAAGAPFQRHPIPQEAWEAATRSAAGGPLSVELTLASGGKAYGPLRETWTVSKGTLKGIVYYQSYGTDLAKNYSGAVGGDGRFGGATLAIKPGRTDPTLVAGKEGGHESCRVCHSVSADGSRMVVQHGEDYDRSSSYDLKSGNTESVYPAGVDLKFAGLYPDGSVGLTSHATQYFSIPQPSALFDLTTGAQLAAPGLSEFVTNAGFPAFSLDGRSVAFNFISGPGDAATGPGDGSRLVAMAYDRATHAFSDPRVLYRGSPTEPPAWPSFLPVNDRVVFGVVVPGNTTGELFATRYGGRGELWWTDLATGTAHRLDALNGKGLLPTSASHPDDSVLNYEPTVCPLPAGGYAWVVFMSRRLYGNVATLEPWSSDPREYDHTRAATTKKLWVAALDLDAAPGTDPSHPAFYLPAQELFAGNTRGFWVVDPCRPDGASCVSGDECCGGYCLMGEITGVCSSEKPGCAEEYDRCAEDGDCCPGASLECVNGRCVVIGPN